MLKKKLQGLDFCHHWQTNKRFKKGKNDNTVQVNTVVQQGSERTGGETKAKTKTHGKEKLKQIQNKTISVWDNIHDTTSFITQSTYTVLGHI